ncbi:hypothetical protein LCGC14_1148240 [marine sediment metagenome]|uniref:Uncharacterized protein n=1 Tax=marine sediment metagenome TaxID=412755 RepID=A0A0F9Q1X3_9ZZZZ
MAEDEMTQEEAEDYLKSFGGTGTAPIPEEKHSVHSFLHKVATADDTTKLGNLKEEEVGLPKLPLRTYKELALFCKEIANMEYFSDYFNKKAEILTSTSLSKEALLLKLAVVIRREQSNILKTSPKENKGWFKKKQSSQGGLGM